MRHAYRWHNLVFVASSTYLENKKLYDRCVAQPFFLQYTFCLFACTRCDYQYSCRIALNMTTNKVGADSVLIKSVFDPMVLIIKIVQTWWSQKNLINCSWSWAAVGIATLTARRSLLVILPRIQNDFLHFLMRINDFDFWINLGYLSEARRVAVSSQKIAAKLLNVI